MTLLLLTLVFCVLPLAAVADCVAAPIRDVLTRSIA